jgi:hypothetical protein
MHMQVYSCASAAGITAAAAAASPQQRKNKHSANSCELQPPWQCFTYAAAAAAAAVGW